MKRILTPILLLTLLFPSLAYALEMKDLVERDGLHYKKFSDVPFTGKTTGRDQGSFKNGKRVGPWVTYHENGQLWSKGNWKDGKLDGPFVNYWDNGQLSNKGTFKDGKRHGLLLSYYDDGLLSSKGNWKDSKRDGPWVFYKKMEPKGSPKITLWTKGQDFIGTVRRFLIRTIEIPKTQAKTAS
jgi:hypothetical protein